MVGVIIINWNGKKFLGDCLNSLRRQTFKNFEIFLVDNNSSDGSQEYIKENFPEVRIIQLDKNYGLGKAFNIGVNEAFKNPKIKYIVLLNSDIKAEPNWLEELMQAVNNSENEKVGIFVPKILFMDNPQIIFSTGQIFKDAHLQERGLLEKDLGQFDDKTDIVGGSSTACLYKREMLEEIGLYREEFFYSAIDMELAWRAQKKGWKAYFVPKSIVYHKANLFLLRKKNEEINKKFAFLDLKNVVWMIKNHGTIKNKILLTLLLLSDTYFYWRKIKKMKPDWKITLNLKSIINLWRKNENW